MERTEKADLTTDVLVIGAGPTGLTLGVALAARGVPVTIVDRLAQGANTSRAAVVHSRTMEVLESIAVAERLRTQGLACRTFTVRDRDRILMSLDFSRLATRYPFTLMVSQATTEAVLETRLGELGVKVLRPAALESFTQDESGVNSLLDNGARIRSRYLVGADGMHSKVRELAGIGFAGEAYAQAFVLADVRLRNVPEGEVILYFSPEGMVVVAPLPGGSHRVVATVQEAPETPTVEDIQRILNSRGPEAKRAQVEGMIWSSRFRVHHRLAEAYRAGRAVLAGDAAHVHSPAGGQGMNTGIQDAVALAGFLVTAVHSGDSAVLDEYEQQRKPAAQKVIALADRLTRVATAPRALSALRNLAVFSVGQSKRFRHNLAWQIAGLHDPRRAA
jgi:2-polyprenyl-6-methoxyphenol hydroxylase-like FAD-dependent oxidoreductase